MSGILKVGGSELINDNGGSGALQWGSGVPSGSIVQVQYTQYTGTAQMTGIDDGVEVVLTDNTPSAGNEILKVDITPRITNSKFLIEAQWQGELNDHSQAYDSVFFFFRGTTDYGGTALKQSGSSGGVQVPWITFYGSSNNDSTPNGVWLRYFDAPSITSGTLTRYKLGYRHTMGNNNQYINTNRCNYTASGSDYEGGISSISVTEIAP